MEDGAPPPPGGIAKQLASTLGGARGAGRDPTMPPIQLDMFPTHLFLASVDPGRNRARFYALSIERNLFGEWSLVRQWGRIGRPGRLRSDLHPSPGAALNALSALARQKRRRGYTAA